MALWTIYDTDGNWLGARNSGETAAQAIASWNAEAARPMQHVRVHPELYERGAVENEHYEGEGRFRTLMCTYTPARTPAASAQRMREVWMDAGYCHVPA